MKARFFRKAAQVQEMSPQASTVGTVDDAGDASPTASAAAQIFLPWIQALNIVTIPGNSYPLQSAEKVALENLCARLAAGIWMVSDANTVLPSNPQGAREIAAAAKAAEMIFWLAKSDFGAPNLVAFADAYSHLPTSALANPQTAAFLVSPMGQNPEFWKGVKEATTTDDVRAAAFKPATHDFSKLLSGKSFLVEVTGDKPQLLKAVPWGEIPVAEFPWDDFDFSAVDTSSVKAAVASAHDQLAKKYPAASATGADKANADALKKAAAFKASLDRTAAGKLSLEKTSALNKDALDKAATVDTEAETPPEAMLPEEPASNTWKWALGAAAIVAGGLGWWYYSQSKSKKKI